ncbi:YrhC family protein [Virgibacillus sp. W0181]|uniref:YrhC family protein n=1 Tax=Virgibacillus sp. W0181 TaxID=3391581 RepID=UPI003F45E27A
MNNSTQKYKWKLIDYERFSLTLIILSCYFYMGAFIATYIEPSENGKIMFYLTCLSLAFAIFFLYKRHQIIKLLDKDEHVQ